MAESRVKDENYFQIHGWMLNRLDLKGTPLDVYAIIYGFSQDGESSFTGSIQYLCDFTNTSRPTVIKALKELVDKGYVFKYENEVSGVKFNKYKANLRVVKKLNWGSKESLQGSKETLPNNKDINNKQDIKDNKIKRETSYDLILAGIQNDSLRELYLDYIRMRKLIKAPMTDRALEMLIGKVNKLEPHSIENQKKLLENAITSNWKSVYPLKEDQRVNPRSFRGEQKAFDDDVFEKPKVLPTDEEIAKFVQQIKIDYPGLEPRRYEMMIESFSKGEWE